MSRFMLALIGGAFILLLTGVLIYFSYNQSADYQQPDRSYYPGQPTYDQNPKSLQNYQSQETDFRQKATESFLQTDKELEDTQKLEQQQRDQQKMQRTLDKFKREQESLQLKRQSSF